MSISVKEANTIIDGKNKEYRDLAIRFRNVCNDLDNKDKEIAKLKDRIDRANNFIDQEIMYIVKPSDYNKVEMLQDILNDNNFAKGSDKYGIMGKKSR